jgi:hypothetical protein
MASTWKYGDKRKLAALAEISPQYLSDILCGRKSATTSLAPRITAGAEQLGYHLTLLDVLYPEDSTNPLIGA